MVTPDHTPLLPGQRKEPPPEQVAREKEWRVRLRNAVGVTATLEYVSANAFDCELVDDVTFDQLAAISKEFKTKNINITADIDDDWTYPDYICIISVRDIGSLSDTIGD